jgi:hypothetical protein
MTLPYIRLPKTPLFSPVHLEGFLIFEDDRLKRCTHIQEATHMSRPAFLFQA